MKGLKFALTGLALGAAWCASAEKLVTHGDTVAMMGDSITQYGTASNSGYPQLFLRAIRTTGVSDFTFVGAGVAGNTSTDMRERFVRDVVNKNPTVVTINSGVNDIRFGFPAHYETYRDNLNYMVDQAKGVGAKVVLMTPTGAAGEGTNELVHALAGIMREVAADKHVILADSYAYFRAAVEDPLAPAMGASGLKATVDGLHMGPVGDRAMARSLVAVMGLTEAEIAAVEEDWNTSPIVGISGIPSISLAQYDMIEAYSDRFKLEIWTAAGDAFRAGLERFLANPVIPAKPTLPAVPSGAASDCAGGAIVMCGGGAWGNEAQSNPSGISRLVTKALAANGSTRPVITGRADGAYLSKIDSDFDKIVANDKDTGAAVSHLVIMPGLENITTDTQSARNIVSKAAAKGITVVFLTFNPLKDSDGDAELNTVLRDLDNGTTVRTIDAYQMRVDEKTRRAANANAHHYIHGNGTLSPRMNYLEGTELLPMLGFNTAAAQRADARWQAIDDFGGSTVSYSIGFGELDQLRAIAFQNNVTVAELYAVCMRLGAEAIADVAPVKDTLTVDPNTMSNNCALVANAVNRIRGTAAPGVRITVYRKGVTAVGYADANGDYVVDFNPGDYEPSYKTTVSDGLNTLTFYTTLVSSIPAHDHVYGTTNYTWTADYTACTAMATCSVCTEKLFENGTVTTVTNVAQTCTTDGSVTSTAVFPTLGTTTKSATVPAGHVWGAPGYEWNTTDWTCTASSSCVRDGAHKTSETVQAQYAVVTPATIYATGLGRYTATFVNAAFASQTYDVEIPKKTGDEGLSPAGEGKDDSNAIQQAIDLAGKDGLVSLDEGTFLINTQLMITNGVTLVGKGWNKTTLKNVAALSNASRVATVKDGGCLTSVTVTGGAVDGANKHGGGILIDGTGTVSWCKVTGNKVGRGFGGGIGVIGKGKATIDHTIVSGNTAPGNTASQVNVPCGAGIGVIATGTSDAVELTVDTCLVSDNVCGADVSGIGGGIYIRGYYVKTAAVRNTTVAGNSASDLGGGLYLEGVFPKTTKISLENSVFTQNKVGETEENVKIVSDKYACVTASYCFFGLASEVLGTDSASGDPGFVGNGDYHLSAAKKLGYSTSESLQDLDGYGRTGALDVGCYAFDGTTPPVPPVAPIVLGTPVARPSTDYNGSAVSVSFTGDIPDGAEVSAKITIGGVDYAGAVGAGVIDFAVPDSAVTAGNTYDATVTLSVGDEDYTKSVELVQGTPKVDEDADWIAESASSFNRTGTWSGDKAAVASGKIAVSNATFTAAKPSVADGQVTVTMTMEFNGPSQVALDPAARAGVQVVKVGSVNRYAFLTGNGVVTNTTATANVSGAVAVKFELDYAKGEVAYTVGGTKFGPFAATAGAKSVSSVRYVGATSVTSLDGSYRYEGLDSNLAQVGDDEYATVADAIAQAGKDAVTLLWDASWSPAAVGDYNVATNGHLLVIGGSLAYSVKDNGDGTVTVTVTGGEEPSVPEAAAITLVGSKVRIAVSDVKADCWYALEKTTDLAEDFELVPATSASGAELLAGSGELEIAIGDGETRAFYRVVVSKTEFAK